MIADWKTLPKRSCNLAELLQAVWEIETKIGNHNQRNKGRDRQMQLGQPDDFDGTRIQLHQTGRCPTTQPL